jgi:hypothetical protein
MQSRDDARGRATGPERHPNVHGDRAFQSSGTADDSAVGNGEVPSESAIPQEVPSPWSSRRPHRLLDEMRRITPQS